MIDLLLIFNTHWIKINAVASSVHFAEKKQFQSEINVGQLVCHDSLRRVISDDQVFSSFKNMELQSTFTIRCWMSLLKLGYLKYTLSSSLAVLLNSTGLK